MRGGCRGPRVGSAHRGAKEPKVQGLLRVLSTQQDQTTSSSRADRAAAGSFPRGGPAPRCSADPPQPQGRGRAACSLLSSCGAARKLQQVPNSSGGHLPLRFPFGLCLQPPPCLSLSQSLPGAGLGAGEPWGCPQSIWPAGAGTLLCPEQRVTHQQSVTGVLRLRAGCSRVLSELGREGRMLRGPGLVLLATCQGYTGSCWGAAGWAALGSPRCFLPRWEHGALPAPSVLPGAGFCSLQEHPRGRSWLRVTGDPGGSGAKPCSMVLGRSRLWC